MNMLERRAALQQGAKAHPDIGFFTGVKTLKQFAGSLSVHAPIDKIGPEAYGFQLAMLVQNMQRAFPADVVQAFLDASPFPPSAFASARTTILMETTCSELAALEAVAQAGQHTCGRIVVSGACDGAQGQLLKKHMPSARVTSEDTVPLCETGVFKVGAFEKRTTGVDMIILTMACRVPAIEVPMRLATCIERLARGGVMIFCDNEEDGTIAVVQECLQRWAESGGIEMAKNEPVHQGGRVRRLIVARRIQDEDVKLKRDVIQLCKTEVKDPQTGCKIGDAMMFQGQISRFGDPLVYEVTLEGDKKYLGSGTATARLNDPGHPCRRMERKSVAVAWSPALFEKELRAALSTAKLGPDAWVFACRYIENFLLNTQFEQYIINRSRMGWVQDCASSWKAHAIAAACDDKHAEKLVQFGLLSCKEEPLNKRITAVCRYNNVVAALGRQGEILKYQPAAQEHFANKDGTALASANGTHNNVVAALGMAETIKEHFPAAARAFENKDGATISALVSKYHNRDLINTNKAAFRVEDKQPPIRMQHHENGARAAALHMIRLDVALQSGKALEDVSDDEFRVEYDKRAISCSAKAGRKLMAECTKSRKEKHDRERASALTYRHDWEWVMSRIADVKGCVNICAHYDRLAFHDEKRDEKRGKGQ